MLKWCRDLRIGESVKKTDRIRRKLNHGKIVPGVYLITFSENPRNLLEIHTGSDNDPAERGRYLSGDHRACRK